MVRPYLIQLNDSELVGCMPYLVRLVGKSRKAGPVVKKALCSALAELVGVTPPFLIRKTNHISLFSLL